MAKKAVPLWLDETEVKALQGVAKRLGLFVSTGPHAGQMGSTSKVPAIIAYAALIDEDAVIALLSQLPGLERFKATERKSGPGPDYDYSKRKKPSPKPKSAGEPGTTPTEE